MKVKVAHRRAGVGNEKRIRAIGFIVDDKAPTQFGSDFFKELASEVRKQVPDLFPGETPTMLWKQTTIHGDSQGVVTRRKISMFTFAYGATWSCESLLKYNPDIRFVELLIHCVQLDAHKF